MKKREKKKVFKDVQFNNSLMIVFLAALVLLIAFALYSKNVNLPIEELEKIAEEIQPSGDECITSTDCPQPRCFGMDNICKNGYCIIIQTSPSATRCFDLKTPICGNDVCEADEKDRCPEDCLVK